MKRNLGNLDKTIRIVLGIVMTALVSLGVVTGFCSYVLLGLGIYFALTSLTGFCPIYYMFGMKSISKKEREAEEDKNSKK